MITLSKKTRLHLLIMVSLLMTLIMGCTKRSDNPNTGGVSEKTSSFVPPEDTSLADFQTQLLDMAFEAAESIAKQPFIKDRSRTQEAVVDTCLEMEQPVRAARLADRIENWRRGLCYAKVSFYLAQNGYGQEVVKPGLMLAEQIAENDHGQKWRSDRIRSQIATVYYLLNDAEQAEQFADGLEEAESGQIAEFTAETLSVDQFENQVQWLNNLLETGNFDGVNIALHAYAELFNRFYDDLEKRELAENSIKSSWHKVPVLIRVHLLVEMAQFAIRQADPSNAERLIEEAYAFMSEEWMLRDSIPVYSELIKLRYQTGDTEKAFHDAKTVLALYDAAIDAELVVYKGKILRPLAEAYISIGQKAQGLALYKRLLNEIAGISNLRIQAEDFSSLCCSMARHAVEPDEKLWVHLHSILQGLVQQ